MAVTIKLATKLPKLPPLTTDTIKAALFTASFTWDQDTVDLYSSLTNEVANGNGYTTGGNTCATPTITQDSATNKQTYDADNPATWTASGAGFSFRYIIIYDSTTSKIIGMLDYGSTVTMSGTNADTFALSFDALGIFTTTVPA